MEMDWSKVLPVVCLTLVIVVGINAALYVAFKRGNEAGRIELFQRAARRAREPWKDEDEALQELSRRVAGLRRTEPEEGEPENQPYSDQG